MTHKCQSRSPWVSDSIQHGGSGKGGGAAWQGLGRPLLPRQLHGQHFHQDRRGTGRLERDSDRSGDKRLAGQLK